MKTRMTAWGKEITQIITHPDTNHVTHGYTKNLDRVYPYEWDKKLHTWVNVSNYYTPRQIAYRNRKGTLRWA